jgi:chromate transporter
MPRLLLDLLIVFAPLSLATIGGGQTIVADIHRQVVDVHHWMTSAQFVDAFAISRMAPGPGSLLVTLIGWEVAGLPGAIVATIAIFGPTLILIYATARIWAKYRGAQWQIAIEAGLRPVAAGMILAAVYVLLQSLEGGLLALAVALSSTAILLTTRANAMILLCGGAAVFAAGHVLGLA